jgi:putative flavoprotein involved in K+ transport
MHSVKNPVLVLESTVNDWLSQLNTALQNKKVSSVETLFAADSYWRDLLAFTWTITPCQGPQAIAELLIKKQIVTKAFGFSLAKDRMAPRRIQRAGIDVIEGIFQFETQLGRGYGVVRLLENEPAKAFQLMTGLHELKGFEETIGDRCPTGAAFSRNFGGTNWKEQREAIQSYSDREPTVLIVGGGQAGLSLAATLGRIGVDNLVIDKFARVGDCWRQRYHSLALHNDTKYNHLPYMPFPPSWPTYLPKDMLADWFEAYAWAMEINFWTSTEFIRGDYDEANGRWNAVVSRADGTEHVLHPKHLVFANGLVGSAHIPELKGLKDFKGEVKHTSDFTNGANWKGKKAIVIGTGTSGHDVAQDLHANGCQTTMVQRGSTMVLSIDPSAKLIYGIYNGVSVDDGDLLASTNTKPVIKKNLQLLTKRMLEFDKKTIDGLLARGFKFDDGEDGAGHQWKVRTRYGGYYLDGGCSQLIIDGEISLMQYDEIDQFNSLGVKMKDGSNKAADLIVLATGFLPQEVVVAKLLGEKVATMVGPVWGFGADGEMSNMWKRTAQRGLWFAGGGFNNCRTYSRYLALQIKAIEEGLLPHTL